MMRGGMIFVFYVDTDVFFVFLLNGESFFLD